MGKNKKKYENVDKIVLFKYTKGNLFHYFAACICIRRRKTLSLIQSFQPHWRLIQGHDKLKRELDVIKIMRSIRDVRLLKDAQLNLSEQILLKFQRSRIIQTSSSSGAEEKFNYRELLEDKDANVRLQALARLLGAPWRRNSVEDVNRHCDIRVCRGSWPGSVLRRVWNALRTPHAVCFGGFST